jgi:hypothetical protein
MIQQPGQVPPTGLNNIPTPQSLIPVANFVWNTGTLTWVMETQPSGGGGAVTIADGADVTLGAIADAAVSGNNPGTVNAHLRGISTQLAGTIAVSATQLPAALVGGRLDTNIGAWLGSVAPTVGQKVSASSLPVVIASDQTAFPVTANQGTANATPWNENLAQVGGAAITQGQKTMAASVPVVIASDQSVLPAQAEARAATLHITATGAVNTAVTATLPAAGAGLFHYITFLQIQKLYSVAGVAAGAGVIITTTNLPGAPAFTTEQVVGAVGQVVTVVDYTPATPLKSSVANTATTIVAPLQLQTIWRINVSYFTAS